MFGFKKKSVSVKAPVVPQFREARSMDTPAIHVETGEHEILCGSERALYGRNELPVTVEVILNSLDNQHSGWYWCSSCASLVTGLSAKEIASARK